MELKRIKTNIFVALICLVVFGSCVLDIKHLAYSVRNCTEDTLLVELTEADCLGESMLWGFYPIDTIEPAHSTDTISVVVHGKRIIYSCYNFALPDTISLALYPFPRGKCYLYAIKWDVAKRYSLDEIRTKKLYDRRIVTKEDFKDHVYEYK